MRQRGVKNRDQILSDCGQYLYLPGEMGPWAGDGRKAYLEIGSGKGKFITEMAALHPENMYFACEGGRNIFIRILQKALNLQLQNLMVFGEYIEDPLKFFCEGALDGIYLNFSDPWPKDAHYKRRLTYRGRIEGYRKIVKPGGFLAFKTDNDSLFEWSLEEFKAAGLQIEILERDLWNSPYAAENVATEYETKFASAGKNINYVLLRFV